MTTQTREGATHISRPEGVFPSEGLHMACTQSDHATTLRSVAHVYIDKDAFEDDAALMDAGSGFPSTVFPQSAVVDTFQTIAFQIFIFD